MPPAAQAVSVLAGPGRLAGMFVWTKRSGRPGRARFYWWPLLLSLLVSVVLTVLLNAAR